MADIRLYQVTSTLLRNATYAYLAYALSRALNDTFHYRTAYMISFGKRSREKNV